MSAADPAAGRPTSDARVLRRRRRECDGPGLDRVALALQGDRPESGPVIPIIGARTRAQLDENLASLDVTLEPSQRARLDDATRIDAGFPHQFLASEMMKKFLSGGDPSQLR